jgi:gamma-aminobutyric acid type B receptor
MQPAGSVEADWKGANLLAEIRRTTLPNGVSGNVRFNAQGDVIAAFTVQNMRDGALTFSPCIEVDPDTGVVTVVQPPVWPDGSTNVPEDVPKRRTLGVSAGIVGGCVTLCAIAATVSIAFHLLVHINRSHKLILASSVIFCHLILSGTLASITGVLIETLADRSQSWSCLAVPWLLSCGFALTFGSLFAKTWRLYKIFGTTKLRVVKITNKDLLAFVGALLLVDTIIVAAWAGADTPSMVLRPDPVRDYVDVYRCSMDHKTLWYALLIVPKLVLLVYGARLAYLVRNVDANFRETANIAASIFLLLLFGAITVPVLMLVQKQIDVAQILLSLGICLAMVNVTGALFAPKFFNIYVSRDWERAQTGTTGGTATGTVSMADRGSTNSTTMPNGSPRPSIVSTVVSTNASQASAVRPKIASLQPLQPLQELSVSPASPSVDGGAAVESVV